MTQTNLFEMLHPRFLFPKNHKIRLFESFAGIGCQKMGLERATPNFEVVGISEIDKYAIKSYEAMHGSAKNFGDITKIKGADLPEIDIFTYSFPCTDLSKAGKQKGLNQTRSGLVYEVLRILAETKDNNNLPKVLIMENVIDLIQVKFIKQFQEIQFELEQMGYSNYTLVMNAKDYGVAQNRQRVFMVSILGDYYYKEPQPFPLRRRLKDYLESNVNKKYYLKNLDKFKGISLKDSSSETKVIFNVNPSGRGMNGNVYSGFVSPTLTTNKGEGPKIAEPICLNSKVDGKQPPLQHRIYDSEGISTSVTTAFISNVTEPTICGGGAYP
jgi:DNA-methyltransferase (dcm)